MATTLSRAAALIFSFFLWTAAGPAAAGTFPDTAVHLVPTFHSIGIYWAPGGNVGNVQVKFRPVTTPASAFRDGQALWFDNRASTLGYGQEYRGSLVELQPGTAYEIQLIPSGASAPSVPPVTTWNTRPDNVADDPATQTIPGGSSNFTITAGGNATAGYKVYDGANAVIDVGASVNNCINVNASFVVVRNVVCRGGLRSGIQIADNVTNVVIEDVEVTDFEQAFLTVAGWGNRGENDEGAVKLGTTGGAAQGNNSKIVVQRSKLHTPRWGAPPWSTGGVPGPYGIFVEQGRGQNVFRWNEIYSTGTDHQWYQDCIGGTPNFSTQGAPGADSDIYQNALRNCYDDGIEAEGGGRNVRVWGNYLDHVGIVMGNASVSIGPFYLWRNVSGQLANIKCPGCTETSEDRGPFIKGGGTDATLNGGASFYYHNTVLQPPGVSFPKGAGFGIGDPGGNLFNFTSRANIWHIHRITDNPGEPDFLSITADCNTTTQPCSADFDLYNGRVFSAGANAEASSTAMGWGAAAIPAGGSLSGTTGMASAVPTYATSNGSYPAASAIPTLENGWVGDLRLAAGSLGTANVPLLPNFNDLDSARHVGAQPPGVATMKFGRAAATQPPPSGGLSVTIDQAAGQADPSSASTINFTAVFSQAATGFTSADVTVSGTAGGTKTVTVTGGPSTYNVAVSGMTTNGTVTVSIPAGAAQNSAGTPNTASTSTDNTVTFTTTPTDPGQAYELDFNVTPAVAARGDTIVFTVAAADARPLQSVRFIVDGTLRATDTTAPYQFSLATTAADSLGNHAITVEATDASNVMVSKARTYTLLAQQCSLFASAASVQQGTPVNIQGLCTTSTSVRQMELSIDGAVRTADVGAPFTWTLDTGSLSAGSHTITLRVVQPSGESSQSASLNVTAAPLTLSFAPGPIAMQSDRMTIGAAATDGRGLRQVDFYIDGVFMRGENAAPYELQWNTTAADLHGRHSLVVIATDTAGATLTATRDLYLTTRTCNVLIGTTKHLSESPDTVYVGPHTIPRGQLVPVRGVCAAPLQRMEFFLDGATTPSSTDSAGPTYTWTLDTTGLANGVHTIAIKGVISPAGESNHSITIEIVDP